MSYNFADYSVAFEEAEASFCTFLKVRKIVALLVQTCPEYSETKLLKLTFLDSKGVQTSFKMKLLNFLANFF